MAARPTESPLVVIVGPTASGKSTLALDIARQFGGEIICADSRTVYKGIDIGTAKPSRADQIAVPHWGLDLVAPNEPFSVSDFKKYANRIIEEIRNRGHIPLLVGGTGLYINAVIFDYQFGAPINKKLRSELQQLTLEELTSYCKEKQINLPENSKNKRYVIRSIENSGRDIKRNNQLMAKSVVVGITTDKILLHARIEERVEQILQNGVVDEARKLGKKYGWKCEAMKSNIYPLVHSYLKNEITIDELKTKAIVTDWRLAKRQLTWLSRNKFIHWETLDEANKYLSNQLVTNK